MDVFGSKLGRIHMTSQDLSKLPNRKMKRVKKIDKGEKDNEEGEQQAKKSRQSVGEDSD